MKMHLRSLVYLGLCAAALVLSLIAVYSYGNWFSHDRYWQGTIARVQYNQALLIKNLVAELRHDNAVWGDKERLKMAFSVLNNHLIVEVFQDEELIFSNNNQRYPRGRLLDKVEVAPGWKLTLSNYLPPKWNASFIRWLKNPSRWFEPSFNHVTFPFLWFLAIHGLALLALSFVIKSRYLQRDVLAVLHKLESRRSEI